MINARTARPAPIGGHLQRMWHVALWMCIGVGSGLAGLSAVHAVHHGLLAIPTVEDRSRTLAPYASAVHAISDMAGTCSQELQSLAGGNPSQVIRALLLEDGAPASDQASLDVPAMQRVLQRLEQRGAMLDATAANIDELARNGPSEVETAAALTASAHRAMLRLCDARDAARGLLAMPRR